MSRDKKSRKVRDEGEGFVWRPEIDRVAHFMDVEVYIAHLVRDRTDPPDDANQDDEPGQDSDTGSAG
jgi:hypothetical protein